LGLILAAPSTAQACGGFFCSQASPVNQAAERIVFSDNGDGTVTAIIQILYQGPSEKFSWVLPISTVPTGDQIAVASNVAFQRLQSATNPTYSLVNSVEGECKSDGRKSGPNFASAAGNADPSIPESGANGGVKVEASGIVGAFEWTVISLDQSLADPSDAAVNWLTKNGYDVSEGARGLFRPYLQDGLYLLALKLTKGADAGSIRPIVLTYSAQRPMIPIKLTAVAANDDMGVMTWLLSSARSVPQNYLSLELNEAKINWFNASSTYNDVVSQAADEAGGQGFVTEYAALSSTLTQRVWSQQEESNWQSVRSRTTTDAISLYESTRSQYGTYDGFADVVRTVLVLPATVSLDAFNSCPRCYASEIKLPVPEYLEALEAQVIEPIRRVQKLIDSRPFVTRLYTTMSAADMTVDPVFTFNPDLPTVSNVHTANRITECNPFVTMDEATWRIELPQGGVIRGRGQPSSDWPVATAVSASNLKVTRSSDSGAGVVLEDNSQRIQQELATYNEKFKADDDGGCALGAKPQPKQFGFVAAFAAAAVALGKRLQRRRRLLK
jgi:hypothetical protein